MVKGLVEVQVGDVYSRGIVVISRTGVVIVSCDVVIVSGGVVIVSSGVVVIFLRMAMGTGGCDNKKQAEGD
jgi:hypothetical protein